MEHLVVVEVLLFLSASVHLSAQDTHTLLYHHTSSISRTDGPDFTAAICVDGEEVVYYDSNISKAIPKTEWIKKIEADYWNKETQRQEREQDTLTFNLKAVMQSFHQTKGDHTLQRMYSCECVDKGNFTDGYMQYCYDGEDFLSLNLTTETWTAVKPQAESVIKTLESIGRGAAYWKIDIEHMCIDWLKKFVSYGGEDLKKKGDKHDKKCQETCGIHHSDLNETLIGEVPKDGGSDGRSLAGRIGIIVAIVIALIAVVAGLVIRKKIISGFTPVSQNSNS